MKNDEIKLLRGNCLELAEQITDRRVIRHQLHRPHLSTMCPRADIKKEISGKDKRPAPGLLRGLAGSVV